MSHRLELESTFRRIYILVTFCFFFFFNSILFFSLSRRALRNNIVNFSTTVTYFSPLLFSFAFFSPPLPYLCIYAHPPRFVASRSIRAPATWKAFVATHSEHTLAVCYHVYILCSRRATAIDTFDSANVKEPSLFNSRKRAPICRNVCACI